MTPVSLPEGATVARRLVSEGYRAILIGGLAVEVAGFGGTKDVDLLVPVEEFDGILYLKGDGLEILSTTGGWVTNGRLTLEDGTTVPFDVLHPSKFVGPGHSGEDFFRYVEQHGSRKTRYGRVAFPSVVYYTRLLVSGPHGELYIERIRRDLDGGAPWSWVGDALAIARQFGTEKRVKPRIRRLETYRRAPGLRLQ